MSEQQADAYKEKFRPGTDPSLDSEVEAALGGMSMDQILAQSPQPQESSQQSDAAAGNTRKGKVIRIGADEVFIDLGGKSQAMAPLVQFTEVKVGDEFEFTVDHFVVGGE